MNFVRDASGTENLFIVEARTEPALPQLQRVDVESLELLSAVPLTIDALAVEITGTDDDRSFAHGNAARAEPQRCSSSTP